MSDYPAVHARFDIKGRSYELLDYEITLERQRPAGGEFTTKEPLPTGAGIFSLGFLGSLYPVASLNVLSSSQVEDERFENDCIEPVRMILDAPFVTQVLNVNAMGALKKIASELGFKFKAEVQHSSRTRSPIFFGTIRNALDQIWEIYGLSEKRWHIDLMNQVIYLLGSALDVEPTELVVEYIKEENDLGVEMEILPRMIPFIPVQHRGEIKIVDVVRFDGKSKSMFLEWATEV